MARGDRAGVDLRIVGRRLPGLRWSGYESIHLGVQRGAEVVDLVPGDANAAIFNITVDVITDERGMDFRGPFVHGKRGERFVYLSWGQAGSDGGFQLFSRAKLHLSALAEQDVTRAVATGATIEAVLELTDERGGPLCAAIRPPRVRWQLASAAAVARSDNPS